jgi:hypothetical protein
MRLRSCVIVVIGLTAAVLLAETRPATDQVGTTAPTSRPVAPPVILFYGRVVDQDGKPLQGAEIVVTRGRLAMATDSAMIAQDTQSKVTFSVYTNKAGNFFVMMPLPMHVLTIDNIKAEGFEWVFDWLGQSVTHRIRTATIVISF